MFVTYEVEELPAPVASVVSVGVFDGVHRGHQEILRANVERARALGARPTVVGSSPNTSWKRARTQAARVAGVPASMSCMVRP